MALLCLHRTAPFLLLSKLRTLSLKRNFLWYLHPPFIQVCGLPACSAGFHPYKHSRVLLLSSAGSSQEPPLTFKPQTSRSVRARASRPPIRALHFKTVQHLHLAKSNIPHYPTKQYGKIRSRTLSVTKREIQTAAYCLVRQYAVRGVWPLQDGSYYFCLCQEFSNLLLPGSPLFLLCQIIT